MLESLNDSVLEASPWLCLPESHEDQWIDQRVDLTYLGALESTEYVLDISCGAGTVVGTQMNKAEEAPCACGIYGSTGVHLKDAPEGCRGHMEQMPQLLLGSRVPGGNLASGRVATTGFR